VPRQASRARLRLAPKEFEEFEEFKELQELQEFKERSQEIERLAVYLYSRETSFHPMPPDSPILPPFLELLQLLELLWSEPEASSELLSNL
jgi:hypothetical protein